jgi:hypothetical protein
LCRKSSGITWSIVGRSTRFVGETRRGRNAI